MSTRVPVETTFDRKKQNAFIFAVRKIEFHSSSQKYLLRNNVFFHYYIWTHVSRHQSISRLCTQSIQITLMVVPVVSGGSVSFIFAHLCWKTRNQKYAIDVVESFLALCYDFVALLFRLSAQIDHISYSKITKWHGIRAVRFIECMY